MSELGFAAQLAEDLSPEDLRLVLDVFRADVTRLAGVLAEVGRADDEVAFRRAAHSLAGAAGAVGAARLEQACRVAMDGRIAMADSMGEIARLADETLTDLDALLARLDGAP